MRKQNKLFQQCLKNVDPNIRDQVRKNMDAIQNACEIARQDERRKFREYLERLKNAYIKNSDNLFNRGLTISSEHYNSQIECINNIINEFFGGE